MSQRGKRQIRLENDDPPPIKRRKGRPPTKGGNGTSSIAGSLGYGSGSGSGSNGNRPNSSNSNLHDSNIDANGAVGTSSAKVGGPGQLGMSSTTAWQARPLSDVKMSSIYNRSAPEPPAELFRKDLISAMKLPDSEPLASDEYWLITDQWKEEWERGVQVPVSPDSLPEPMVLAQQQESFYTGRQDFKLYVFSMDIFFLSK